jgi:nucleotide-binding universal stress UspA family protein
VPQLVPALDDERREMKVNLQAVTQRCQGLGIRSSSELLTHAGNPQYAILQAVAEVGADMIVMGTHGRSGLTRLVAGSVTEAVLRHSRIPVLAVPPPDGHAAS